MIAPRWLGVERRELARCASTNDEAAAMARAGAAHGAVVTARCQTEGRGRGAHTWFSPDAENLYLSCVLRPELPPTHVPPITLAAGIAVCDAVNSYGARASLKWPNDVLAQGRKLAGILTEMSTRGQVVDHVVLGIGVNVNVEASALPAELASTAISLRDAIGGRRVDLAAFTLTLMQQLEAWLDRFFRGGVEAISAAWTERACVAGRRVKTEIGLGRARGIDREGALLLEDDRGVIHRVVAGEVVVLG